MKTNLRFGSVDKKLTALLSAGATGSIAASGQAAIIYTDITDVQIGQGFLTTFSIDLPGIHDLVINVNTASNDANIFLNGGYGFEIARISTNSNPIFFNLNDAISGALNFGSAVNIASWSGTASSATNNLFPNSAITDKRYLGFRFTDTEDSNIQKFGWVGITLSISATEKPVLTVYDYAYENTGASITIPEPSSKALLAAGLLLAGATGLKSWRSRKSAETTA
ncbi:MAG: hypothetical protein ACFCUX_02475 [Candidatus Methylacidiphilales bacterium]